MLREDAVAIWKAGVAAVDSETLVRKAVRRHGQTLRLVEERIDLSSVRRIVVVGAGKAGAGMAAGLEEALGPDVVDQKVTGWVNVPADCVRTLRRVHLHAARPAGCNEPCPEGVEGAKRILELVSSCGPEDICVVLLSGGGSALLPAPAPGISLEDKLRVTRLLMSSGASIDELNVVRKQLSSIKGGKLARASRAGLTVSLVISDVVGDRLDVIASGPTFPDRSTPRQALDVLRRYARQPDDVPASVWAYLERAAERQEEQTPHFPQNVRNFIIGSNRTALEACRREAERRGYFVLDLGSDQQGVAQDVGRELARLAVQVREQGRPVRPPACLLSGGEPVVRLARTDRPRKGGRNQELVLAAVDELWDDGMDQVVVLSGGTDGEDGPTDAAGAVADQRLIQAAKQRGLTPKPFLEINNSYPFFAQLGGLLKTGPTHTNVMDVRVALVAPGA